MTAEARLTTPSCAAFTKDCIGSQHQALILVQNQLLFGTILVAKYTVIEVR